MPLPSTVETVSIVLAERSYPIHIAGGLLGLAQTYDDLPASGAALIVTNTTVAPLYAEALRTALLGRFRRVHLVVLPDGEVFKTWETLHLIFDALLQHGCDRRTVLFALGGGVVGDMTGFAAASFMRGVPFVQVPTTLLAQVDSSVGGKTAINHPLGKNMIGAFYQPLKVVCDLHTLRTLPQREVSAGLAEIIKYGPIADMDFLAWIGHHMEDLRACEPASMAYAVRRSCEIKASVVGQDERETGLRAILNFGHTFGHAIEAGMGYGRWLHGEAVGCGMVMATRLSQALGLVDAAFAAQLVRLIASAGLPTLGPVLPATARDPAGNGVAATNAQRYLALMRVDKKAQDGDIKFVLIDGPGRAIVRSAPDALVSQVIDDCCR